MNPVMKYADYARKNTAKFRKKKFDPLNWDTDERGFRMCPMAACLMSMCATSTETPAERFR